MGDFLKDYYLVVFGFGGEGVCIIAVVWLKEEGGGDELEELNEDGRKSMLCFLSIC